MNVVLNQSKFNHHVYAELAETRSCHIDSRLGCQSLSSWHCSLVVPAHSSIMRMHSSSFHINIYLVSKGFAYTTGGDISLPGRYKGQGKACLMIPSLDHELKGSGDCFPSLKESCVKYLSLLFSGKWSVQTVNKLAHTCTHYAAVQGYLTQPQSRVHKNRRLE